MRTKAALITIAITFAIIALSLGSSLFLTRYSLTETIGNDITLALDIANDLVSTRINLYKSDVRTVAERLMNVGSADAMRTVMRSQLTAYPDFLGFAVYDRNGLYAGYGDTAAAAHWLNGDKYMENAFNGMTLISTTGYADDAGRLVMRVCTPMDASKILTATIPGTVFSDLLRNYRLWDNGNIFMCDEDGTLIAHFVPDMVNARVNYVTHPDEFTPETTVDFFRNTLASEKGRGEYTHGGIVYQCAYSMVYAPPNAWHIMVSVPISESPITTVQNKLVALSFVFLLAGSAAAFFLSGRVVKPYYRIAEQNHDLEELNTVTRAQSANLLEVHQRVKLMMDATPMCSMLWDSEGNIFDCNEECVRTFKMKDKQEFLDNFFNLSPVYQPNGQLSKRLAREHISRAFDEGRHVCGWIHQMLDGTPIPCEMTLVRVRYGEGYIVAAYARDQREQKKMTAETLRLQAELKDALKGAQDANSAKSSFLASMSHEMRTPLNAVVGLSELILNTDEVKGETADRLDKIHSSGMTLLGIVNDILDLSKIESGKFNIHPIKYETASLINDIVSLNIVRIGEKPVEFKLDVDENMPESLYGDDLRIKQIFNNLLSNALKYTKQGRVDWKVTFEQDCGNTWVISEVRDTGVGIKPEDIGKLFKDYSQVEADTHRKTESTGLGLAITKRLIDMMDGEISVESEYGVGSVFRVRLLQLCVSAKPIGKVIAENLMSDRFAAVKRMKSAGLTRLDMSYARVLVVDDVQTNLDVAKGMLKPYKISVDCASSGMQAIEMVRDGAVQYDAIFMDHMMPEMDGIETTGIILDELGPIRGRHTPIIALTANAIAGNEKMFLEHGFSAFITKPIDLMRLDAVLRQWVRDKDRENGGAGPVNSNRQPVGDICGGLYMEGLDTEAGVKRFGNIWETYISILRSYIINTRLILTNMNKKLEEGNLSDYAIYVHGIKGSSFGVGANRAGDEAERLEFLAKAGDADGVNAGNGAFCEYLRGLLVKIGDMLDKYESTRRKPAADAPDAELLEEIRAACDNYDVDRADEIMEALESYEYENGGGAVVWLRDKIDNMEFGEIAEGKWMFDPDGSVV